MSELVVANFGGGLDARKFFLSLPPGTLTKAINAHITSGAELEKRLAFVQSAFTNGTGYAFGPVTVGSGLMVFGSASPGSVPSLPAGVTYQQLADPTGTGAHMTGIAGADTYGSPPGAFVAAQFSDGNTYCFYKGVLVEDFIAGLAFPWNDTDAEIAQALVNLINALATSAEEGELVYTAARNGSSLNIFSTPNVSTSAPYVTTPSTILESGSTGALTANLENTGVPGLPAVQATGSFQVTAGTSATQATGSINGSASSNVSNGDTVTIGGVVYTFVTSLSNSTANQIAIAGSGNTDTSLGNLAAALNGTGTPGTSYSSATVRSTTVTAGSVSSHNLTLTAIAGGTPGNAITLAKSSTVLTVSGSVFSGGVNNNGISAVDVGGTNLITVASTSVPFDQSATQTAIDLVTNINANTGVTGFSAQATGNTVTIFGPTTSPAYVNGLPISVTTVGEVAIQLAGFVVANPTANTSNVSSVTVGGGSNIMTATITYQDAGHASETLAQFAGRVAANISANQGTSGYTATTGGPSGTAIYISPVTSSSNTNFGAIVLTYSTLSISAIGNSPVVIGLSVQSLNVQILLHGKPYGQGLSSSVIITASGGTAPYTYSVTGLPAGASARFSNNSFQVYYATPANGGNPSGLYTTQVTATDSLSGTASANLPVYFIQS